MVELADINRRKNGEHSALQDCNEVLEANQGREQAADGECRGQGRVEGQREGQSQAHASENMQQCVSSKHIDPKSDAEGDGPEAVRDGLEWHEDEGHGPRSSSRDEMSGESESELREAEDSGCCPHSDTKASRKAEAGGRCLIERDETKNIACDDGQEQCRTPSANAGAVIMCINNGRQQAAVNLCVWLVERSLAAPKAVDTKQQRGLKGSALDLGDCTNWN